MIYKDFEIEKYNNVWTIRNCNGNILRKCRTKAECINRIDNQTI